MNIRKAFGYYRGGGSPYDPIPDILALGGAYWDASDISTLFQNTAGTTPVTTAGQTVRCIKDKSGNGWHLTNTAGDLYQVDASGRGYVNLSGTTGAHWLTTSSTAGFKFLYDGLGGSLITVVERSNDALTPRSIARNDSSQRGVNFGIGGNGVPQIQIFGETAASIYVQQISPLLAPFAPGRRGVHMYTLDNAFLHQYLDKSTPYKSTAVTGSAATSNSGQSFFIVSSYKGKFFSQIAIGKVLSTQEWTSLSATLNATHGRTLQTWTHAFASGGQSNEEGSNAMDASSEVASENVLIYDKADKLRIATEPAHDRTNWIPTTSNGGSSLGHSNLLKMAKDINAADGSIIPVLIPGAVGGTGMADWMPTANRFDRTTLYGSLNARLQALGATPCFIWFGHEADTGLTSEDLATGTFGTAYQEAFNDLMDEWRIDYPTAPIIFCQLSTNNTATAQKRRAMEALRRCEASYGGAYALSNSYMVVTHDVKRNASADDVHLSQEGQIEVGRRIALAYRGGVSEEAINWEGPRLVSITKQNTDEVLVKFSQTINDNLNDFGDLFRVYSDGSEHTITSAVRDSVDDTSVLITLSAGYSGVVVVTYGERNTANNVVRADVVVDGDGLPAPVFGPVVAT
jgi:hypothetical protein